MSKKILQIFNIFLDFLFKFLLLKFFVKFLKKYKLFIFFTLFLFLGAFTLWFASWDSSDFLNFKQSLIDFSKNHSFLSLLSFFIFYFIVSLLGLPGTAFLGSIGGFVFGFFKGFFVSLTAVVLGSCFAFLVVRFFFRDFFIKSLKKRKKIMYLNKFYDRLKENEAYYLATFRMFPFSPLAVTNIVMGLGKMRLRIFLFVCFITILPYLLIYVHIGSKLSQLKSWNDLYDFNLLLSFTLLAFFPLSVKLIVKRFKREKFDFSSKEDLADSDLEDILTNQS
ncbi:MAG: TVP38/TMEM64 family protein [Bdellovibrionales bacterium]|nr:TVP38/TMEM64 family protein [Bdellovibrionales bacterium]